MPAAPTRSSTPSDRALLLTIIATVAVFLAISGYPRQWSQGLLINDEFWYAHLTRSLYQGDGYVSNVMYPLQASRADGFPVPEAMKQPGFQLVAALVWRVTGESARAMLVVALAGLTAFAAGIFLLARRLGWSRGVASFVAFACVAHPVMAQYGVQALPESLYFACFIFTVLFLIRGGAAGLVAAGVLNATLMLVKGHGVIYIPVFVAYLWLRDATTLTEGLRPDAAKLRAAGTYVVACSLTLVLASLVLPAGSVQLFQAGGSYSQGMLIEVGRVTSDVPYLSVDPPPAWEYIRAHPGEYLGKVARMVKRTKLMVDTLAGPALGGVLLPALMLSCFLLIATTLSPGKLLAAPRSAGEERPYLLFAAAIGWALLFFWSIYLSARFIIHMLPLMVLICLHVGSRLGSRWSDVRPDLRRVFVAAAILWFIAYPASVTLWDSYRAPRRLLGSMLAVRYLDYDQMARNVEDNLPAEAVVISDMAHEIVWLTGRRAIAFPNGEEDLQYLVDKFDVDAVYEHPRLRRDWPAITEQFRLVDQDNGFLWVRRDVNRTGTGARR